MTPLVKALLALALVVPIMAYVAGSLAGTGGQAPEQQGTVYIDDASPVSERTSPPSRPEKRKPARPLPSPTGENQPTQAPDDDSDDEQARVVTPAPVEDDDDERDEERDDDQDDDTDDGGDRDDD